MQIDIITTLKNLDKTHGRKRLPLSYLNENWAAVGYTFSKNYKVDELAQKYINYFSQSRYDFFDDLKATPQKGMRVFGPKGLGKTLNFLIYARICRLTGQKFFEHYEMKEIEHGFKLKGAKFIDKLLNIPELAISDIGTEESTIKNYGTNVNLIDDILSLRYIKFQTMGFITHVTTNLSNELYHKAYGDRHDDRANEMFLNIQATGGSKRL